MIMAHINKLGDIYKIVGFDETHATNYENAIDVLFHLTINKLKNKDIVVLHCKDKLTTYQLELCYDLKKEKIKFVQTFQGRFVMQSPGVNFGYIKKIELIELIKENCIWE
jgi:hypothetical protein